MKRAILTGLAFGIALGLAFLATAIATDNSVAAQAVSLSFLTLGSVGGFLFFGTSR